MGRLADRAEAAEVGSLPKRLRLLYDLLQRKGIDLADLEAGSVKKVGFWQAMHKDDDGEAVITDLARIELSPSWDEGPEWPVIQPAPMPKPAAPRKPTVADLLMAVCVPDLQIGYYWTEDGLVPTHDEAYIRVVLGLIKAAQPADVVLHGDNADFPELSKYRLLPTFQRTTQATIDRCAQLAAELRAAAPNARIHWLAGNHEERLQHFIVDNARAAFGLRRGRRDEGPPEKWPALSLPGLCWFDELGVEFYPGYPANRVVLSDNLHCLHGHFTGPTAAQKYLAESDVSVIVGHDHHTWLRATTRMTERGPRTKYAASAGCGCRTDGAVPGTKSGYTLDGAPIPTHTDWQQGVAVVEYEPDGIAYLPELVPVYQGRAVWRGNVFEA